MKKMLILVVIAMIAVPLFAEEAVLIDFSTLTADIHIDVNPNDKNTAPNQNRQTVMDFSHTAGSSFTAEQKKMMITSLAIPNWEVHLASSSRFVDALALSFTKEAKSKEYNTVLGVRIRFPIEPYNSWAKITPPFDIPAYELSDVGEDGKITAKSQEEGFTNTKSRFEAQEEGKPAYGVIKNVGVIREIKVRVYGLNFPHGLSTCIVDSMGIEKTMFMGYMQFDGWGDLIWRNPAYMQEVRNRDLRIVPLYPFNTPFIKFAGFLIQRDAAKEGGDFVTYFKDVTIIYDLAVLDADKDINDEAIWNIIQTREEKRKAFEMERFGQQQVLRYIEMQKQATELPFNDPKREEAAAQNQ
jgi:hypothetical protein